MNKRTMREQAQHAPGGSWWTEPLTWEAFTARMEEEWRSRMKYRGGDLAFTRPGLITDAQLDLRRRQD